jgi:hypothetical protein
VKLQASLNQVSQFGKLSQLLVKKHLCVDLFLANINVNICHDFLRRVRRYMLMYYHYTLEGDGNVMGFEKNQRFLKAYKSHHDANPSDGKDFMQMLCKSCAGHLINISI